jgi:hypothetical protein
MAEDLLKRTTEELRKRMKELEPQVQEHKRLQNALAALDEPSGEKSSPRRPRGGSGRGRRRTTSSRAGRGERRQQLLRVVQAEPGIRPSKAAHQMGINPSQLHALSRRLEEGGELQRRDGGLHLPSSEPQAAA